MTEKRGEFAADDGKSREDEPVEDLMLWDAAKSGKDSVTERCVWESAL
jgi:hypothetical protein